MAHTPGPWTAKVMDAPGRAWHGQWEIHWSDDGECVAEIVFKEDDARLIAAAPALLAVCEYALANLPSVSGEKVQAMVNVRSELRTAIALTKGGAPCSPK